MNTKRFIFSALAGFIFIFAFEFIFHGMLLKPAYEQTASLWRSPEEMQNFFQWSLMTQILFAGMMAYIFTRNFEGKGIGEGVRFGLMFGILMGVAQFGMYAYMPIPMSLALAWAGGAVVEMTGLGIIFALIYKKS